jgi:hypothetical protein
MRQQDLGTDCYGGAPMMHVRHDRNSAFDACLGGLVITMLHILFSGIMT